MFNFTQCLVCPAAPPLLAARAVLILNVLFAMPIAGLAQATLYVDLLSTNPSPPHLSWDTAATNIQDAVSLSSDGDIILVATGRYDFGTQTWSGCTIPARLVITNAIKVQGFAEKENTLIVGGNSPANPAVRCAVVTGGAILENITLTGGNIATNSTAVNVNTTGGGAYASGGTLAGCVVTNCTSSHGGGVYGGTITNCLIGENFAMYGGGVYGGTVIDSTIRGNFTTKYGGGSNGSIVSNSLLLRNIANLSGGGGISGGSIYRSTVSSNTAKWGGGCYYAYAADCRVTHNTATWMGGGMYIAKASGTPASTRCFIAYNESLNREGGVSAYDTLSYLADSAVVYNKAPYGGGGSAPMNHCTVAFNEATVECGGVYDLAGPFFYMSCVIYSNTAPFNANYDPNAANYVMQYSCIDPLPIVNFVYYGQQHGLACIDESPMFKRNNYHIKTESPCVSNGVPDAVYGTIDIDAEAWRSPPAMGADEPIPPPPEPPSTLIYIQ